MKVVILLLALMIGALPNGGNNGGVGKPLPLKVIMLMAHDQLIDLPFYGKVYVRDLQFDEAECSIHVVFETQEGAIIKDDWPTFHCEEYASVNRDGDLTEEELIEWEEQLQQSLPLPETLPQEEL